MQIAHLRKMLQISQYQITPPVAVVMPVEMKKCVEVYVKSRPRVKKVMNRCVNLYAVASLLPLLGCRALGWQ